MTTSIYITSFIIGAFLAVTGFYLCRFAMAKRTKETYSKLAQFTYGWVGGNFFAGGLTILYFTLTGGL